MSAEHRPTPRRPARPDETCSCGRPAVEVLLYDDLGPLPSCQELGDHKPGDCPAWCTDQHSAPFDRVHYGETYGVQLDAHTWTDRVRGEWETGRHSILAGLVKDSGDKPAYIAINGQNDEGESHLTAYEAERLADILRELAATLRAVREK